MLSIEETESLRKARSGDRDARESLYNGYFAGNLPVAALLSREVPAESQREAVLRNVYSSLLKTESENRDAAKLQSGIYRLVQVALLGLQQKSRNLSPACPGAEELSQYHSGEIRGARADEIKAHLRECPACRSDLAFLARSQEPRERTTPLRRRMILMGIAAAGLIASLLPWPWNKKPAKTPEKLDFTPSSTYRSLAHVPLTINAQELRAESPSSHRRQLDQVIAAYEREDFQHTAEYARIMTDVVEDPSAWYLQGVAEYRQGKLMDAYASMKAAERLSPSSAYRCWATLQLALAVGDKTNVLREAQHTSADARYRNETAEILTKCCMR